MSLIQTIILGFVQGLTEFIPVSSSGHLVVVPFFLSWQLPSSEAFVFDVLVQVATLAAVFTYFWSDLKRIIKAMWHEIYTRRLFNDHEAKIGWLLMIATLPAGFAGLLVKPMVEKSFESPLLVGIFLLITSLLLLLAERVGSRNRMYETITIKDVIWMGIFQALAIFPGISRSGATIAAGMFSGLQRPAAARFSFLMSIPIMFSAGMMSIYDLLQMNISSTQLIHTAVGCIVAGCVGYISIRWLLKYLMHRSLFVFSIYCAILGGVTIVSVLLSLVK